MRMQQAQRTGWLAHMIAALWTINLLAHIQIYTSRAVVPLAQSHSTPVESLGAVAFFLWFLFTLQAYNLLAPRALGLARWGLALGIVGMLSLSILHILFVFEVFWFSDTLALLLLGCGAAAVWALTVLYRSRGGRRGGQKEGQGNAIHALRIVLSVIAYPLWPILLWRRISASSEAIRREGGIVCLK